METGIQKYENFGDLTKSAPALLEKNQSLINRAVTAGESLLAKIQANGMSAELDKEINDYLVKLNAVLKLVKEKRIPITQVLSTISKEFTTCEQLLDSKRPDTTWAKLQKIRNDFAKEVAEKARLVEAEKQLKINKENEISQLKTRIEEHVNLQYNNFTYSINEGLRSIFNDLSLEEWDQGVKIINEYTEEITIELYRTWIIPYVPVFISKEESNETIRSVMTPKLVKLNADLQVKISSIKQEFVNEYPAKKNELVAIQEASENEKKRLKKERIQREKEQAEKLAAEKLEEDKKAQNDAISKQKEAKINTMFETESVEANKPKRTGYQIAITSQLGYLELMNLWFEKEGKALPFDALERMTIARIKKFCEVYAQKFDEKLQSPYLKYEEVFNQKAK